MLFTQRKPPHNKSFISSFLNVLYTSKAKVKSKDFQDFVWTNQNLSKHSTEWFNSDLWLRMLERLQEELSYKVNYKWTRNVGLLHKSWAQFSELNTMIATWKLSSRCMYNMLHHGAETVYIYFVCAQCNYDKAIPWNELTSVRTTTEQHSSLLFFLHRTKPPLHTISLEVIWYL